MRPRERLVELGASALSDGELLAVILGTGTTGRTGRIAVDTLAQSLIERFGGLESVLDAPAFLLEEFSGIGSVKASRLAAAAEIRRRGQRTPLGQSIASAEDAWRAFSDLATLKREEIWLGILNHRNCLLKRHQVSAGTVNQASVSPREIVRIGVKFDGVRLILAHNHPSGDPLPSAEDIEFTESVFKATRMVGLELIDHVIVGGDSKFFSFSKEGFMPTSRPNSSECRPFAR